MNRYRLVHVTEFQYDGPVSESYNQVRLRPMHDERQSCLSFRLTTAPHTPPTSHKDHLGNWVHQFNVLVEHRRLRVEAESVVLVHQAPVFPSNGASLADVDRQRDQLEDEYYDFLADTGYVPHLAALEAIAAEAETASGGRAAAFVQIASDLIHAKFRYEKGATHVQSSILDALAIGAGVCQDFAHIMLGVARMRGLPARYVSGYLVPSSTAEPGASVEEVIGGQASHAWAEVFVPGLDWISVDPTLGGPVSSRHVRIAYGRDYGDVAPVRGVYKGHAGQRLSVDVRVRPALDGEGHEQLQETAAGPAESSVNEPPQQQQQQQQ